MAIRRTIEPKVGPTGATSQVPRGHQTHRAHHNQTQGLVWSGHVRSVLKGLELFGTIRPISGWDGRLSPVTRLLRAPTVLITRAHGVAN